MDLAAVYDYDLNIQTLLSALIDRYSFAQTSYRNSRRNYIHKHARQISSAHPKMGEAYRFRI